MKVLLADGNPDDLHYCETCLKAWGFEVVAVSDGNAAHDLLLAGDGPMIAILDWTLPGMDAIAICRAIRKAMTTRYVYFIVVTAHKETEFAVAAMNAGADDFIGKPFDADELRARVQAGHRICQLEQGLRLKGTHDTLTGIYNRGAIMDILQKELARHERERCSLAIIFADLDHFKKVNNDFGHLAGDVVLREVTHRVGSTVRPYDWVGRYGGEHLLIVLPTCEAATAIEVAERIRQTVAEKTIATHAGQVAVTVSMGVVCLTEQDYPTLGELIQEADKALYLAKQGGRNRIEVGLVWPDSVTTTACS
jgi:two-component system cell cycle response regulator